MHAHVDHHALLGGFRAAPKPPAMASPYHHTHLAMRPPLLPHPLPLPLLGEHLTLLHPEGLDMGVAAPGGGGGRLQQMNKKEERIPQWGHNETKDFIAIRAELEKDFTQTKRNKTLWELISGKMKEKSYRRSADQCKCKWKNLVNRYKGKETSEPDNGRQCPFFAELHTIFIERAKNMDRLYLESEPGLQRPPKKKAKLQGELKLSDDDTDDEEDPLAASTNKDSVDPNNEDDERLQRRKKRKSDKERQRVTADKYRANSMQEVLDDFFRQQVKAETVWRDVLDRRELERGAREQEWRRNMEFLEHDRMNREHAWREREDEWRDREEMRAAKRDELFTQLFTKYVPRQTQR